MAEDQQTWSGANTSGTGGGRAMTPAETPPVGGVVGQTAQVAKQAAGQAAQQAQQAAAPITEQVQQTAGHVAEQAKQQAFSQASTQKDHAAGSLDAVATALRQSGDQLRNNQQEPLANLAGMAAGHVEQFSGYLRRTDVPAMIRDVEQFARRQPAAFLGGAFTLGVLAARFLKSSSQNSNAADMPPSGRLPSYRGYTGSQYASSGARPYPTPASYGGVGGLGSGGSSIASSGLDIPAAGPRDGDLGTSSGERTLDRSGVTTTASPSGGATGSGWGYTPRGSVGGEKEAR
ncbi:MAG TPA: hypothetical protein VGP33_03910 [Chloroflexota bacterium]|nr:hypothetical protein [Chloroflexota bacterium]